MVFRVWTVKDGTAIEYTPLVGDYRLPPKAPVPRLLMLLLIGSAN